MIASAAVLDRDYFNIAAWRTVLALVFVWKESDKAQMGEMKWILLCEMSHSSSLAAIETDDYYMMS